MVTGRGATDNAAGGSRKKLLASSARLADERPRRSEAILRLIGARFFAGGGCYPAPISSDAPFFSLTPRRVSQQTLLERGRRVNPLLPMPQDYIAPR
jgi:hypothetical protein